MDRSDSVPLLLTVCHVVGEWILSPRSTIVHKEKTALLSKMASLDRIPEVAAQPLINYFLRLCLQMHASGVSTDPSSSSNTSTTTPAVPGAPSQPPGAKPAWMSNPAMHKPYTVGLMSADPSLRAEFFSQLYSTTTRNPGQRVMQIIKQEWEPLNQRFYVVVMAEAMIAALHNSTSMDPNQKMIEVITTRPSTNEDILHHHPSRHNTITAHDLFLKKVVDARTNPASSLLEPLRLLMHLDIALSNVLWQVLLQSSWMTLSEGQQNGMHQHLSSSLTKVLHRQSLYIPHSLAALNQGAPQNTIQALLQVMVVVVIDNCWICHHYFGT